MMARKVKKSNKKRKENAEFVEGSGSRRLRATVSLSG